MSQKNKLYIGNLPFSANDSELREVFSSYGEIEDSVVITDRQTGRSKGFGFITFSKEEDAEKALEQNGKDMGGRTLRVNVAMERPPRGDRRPR